MSMCFIWTNVIGVYRVDYDWFNVSYRLLPWCRVRKHLKEKEDTGEASDHELSRKKTQSRTSLNKAYVFSIQITGIWTCSAWRIFIWCSSSHFLSDRSRCQSFQVDTWNKYSNSNSFLRISEICRIVMIWRIHRFFLRSRLIRRLRRLLPMVQDIVFADLDALFSALFDALCLHCNILKASSWERSLDVVRQFDAWIQHIQLTKRRAFGFASFYILCLGSRA